MRRITRGLQVMVTNRRHMADWPTRRIIARKYSLNALLFGRSSAD